jgi:hypothetical protein
MTCRNGLKKIKNSSFRNGKFIGQPLTACKQYCFTAGATQGNIAYTQTVMGKLKRHSGQTSEPPKDNFDSS